MKLLIVEDDRDTSDGICEYFRVAGYEVTPVYDGENALTLARQYSYDLILLDVMLPKLLLLPPSILLFGAGMVLGNRKGTAVYVLLAAILFISVFQIKLPALFDIVGNLAIQSFNEGKYEFAFSPAFIAGRVVISVFGIALIIVSLFRSKKRSYC